MCVKFHDHRKSLMENFIFLCSVCLFFIRIFLLRQLALGAIKTTDKRKLKFSFCNKRKIAVKPTIHENLAVSKALFGKF